LASVVQMTSTIGLGIATVKYGLVKYVIRLQIIMKLPSRNRKQKRV